MFPLTVIDTIANALILGVSIAIIVILVRVERRVRRNKKTMYPYVLLYRKSGDAVAIGTFAVLEHARNALKSAVREEVGISAGADMPPAVLERFNGEGDSWKGKNMMGDIVHVWISRVQYKKQ